MANRSIKVFTSVAANTTVNTDSAVIPNGTKIRLVSVTGADVNTGDNKSSLFLIQWGSGSTFTEVCAFTATGSTVFLPLSDELIGNGVNFIRITRQNTSATAKRVIVWLRGYDV